RKSSTAVETVTDDRSALIYPKDYTNAHPSDSSDVAKKVPPTPWHRITADKNFGVMFAIILLLVIAVTNVPLRGMWSLVVIITVIKVAIIFALGGTWDWIFEKFSLLAIFMNAGGYFFIAIILLILWALAMFIFDRQIYIVFTPGQFRVCHQIGGGEQVFST